MKYPEYFAVDSLETLTKKYCVGQILHFFRCFAGITWNKNRRKPQLNRNVFHEKFMIFTKTRKFVFAKVLFRFFRKVDSKKIPNLRSFLPAQLSSLKVILK